MAEIHNLKELNKLGRDLRLGDGVCFTTRDKVIKYEIVSQASYGTFLFCGNHDSSLVVDYLVFNYLGLDNSEKYKLAEKCYRYKSPGFYQSHDRNWPVANWGDFLALERLIREIYKMLSDNSVEILDPSQFITNRFEILDL